MQDSWKTWRPVAQYEELAYAPGSPILILPTCISPLSSFHATGSCAHAHRHLSLQVQHLNSPQQREAQGQPNGLGIFILWYSPPLERQTQGRGALSDHLGQGVVPRVWSRSGSKGSGRACPLCSPVWEAVQLETGFRAEVSDPGLRAVLKSPHLQTSNYKIISQGDVKIKKSNHLL